MHAVQPSDRWKEQFSKTVTPMMTVCKCVSATPVNTVNNNIQKHFLLLAYLSVTTNLAAKSMKNSPQTQIWVNSETDSTVGTWKQMWCDYCVSHLLELQHVSHISLKTEPHSQCLCPSFIYSLWSLILLHIWFVCPCGLSSLITVDCFSFWSAAASDPSGLHHVSVFTNPTLHQ